MLQKPDLSSKLPDHDTIETISFDDCFAMAELAITGENSKLEDATPEQRVKLTRVWFTFVNEHQYMQDQLLAISRSHPLLQRAHWFEQYPSDAWCTLCLSMPDNIKNHLSEQFKPLFHEIFKRRLPEWSDTELQTLQSAFAKQPKLFFILTSELTYRLNRQRDQPVVHPLQPQTNHRIIHLSPVWCRDKDLLPLVLAYLDNETLWQLRLVNKLWHELVIPLYYSDERQLLFYQAEFQGSTLASANHYTFVDEFLGHWSPNLAPLYPSSNIFSPNDSPKMFEKEEIQTLQRALKNLAGLSYIREDRMGGEPVVLALPPAEICQSLHSMAAPDETQSQRIIEAEKQSPEEQKALIQQLQKQALALARLCRSVEAMLNLFLLRVITRRLALFEGTPEENEQIRHIIWHSRLTRWLTGRDIVALNYLEALDWKQPFVMGAYLKNLTRRGLELQQKKATLTEEESIQQAHIMQILFRLSDEDLLFYVAHLPDYLRWSHTINKQPSQREADVIATAISYCVLYPNNDRLQLILNTVGAERFGCALFQLNVQHLSQLLQQYPTLMRAWLQSLNQTQLEHIERSVAANNYQSTFNDYWSYWQNPNTHGFIPRKTFLSLFADVFVHNPENQPLCLYYFFKYVSWDKLVKYHPDVVATLLSLFQTRPDVLSQLFAKDTALGSEWLMLLFQHEKTFVNLAHQVGRHSITIHALRASYQPLVCWLSAEQIMAMAQALATPSWFETYWHTDNALNHFWRALLVHRRMTTALFERFLAHPAFYPSLVVPPDARLNLSSWLPEVYREIFIRRIKNWSEDELTILLGLFPPLNHFTWFSCEAITALKFEQNLRADTAFKQEEYDKVAAGIDVTLAPKWYRASRLNIPWPIRLMLGVGGAVALCFGLSVLLPWLALPAVMISMAVVCGVLALATPKLMAWYESHFALLFQDWDKTPSQAEKVFAQTAPDLPPVVRWVAGLLMGLALGAALGILIPGLGWVLGGAIGILVGAGLGYLADMIPPEHPAWLLDQDDSPLPAVIEDEDKKTVRNTLHDSPFFQPDNEQPDESLLPETNPENKSDNAFQLIQQ